MKEISTAHKLAIASIYTKNDGNTSVRRVCCPFMSIINPQPTPRQPYVVL